MFLVIYLFSTFGIFCVFIISKSRQLNSIEFIEFKNFSCLKIINPFLVFVLAINFFSLAGVPPLSGFISKFMIFTSLIELNYIFLISVLIIISLISAYYYIRPIKLLIFHNTKEFRFLNEISFFSGFIIICIFFFNLFFILEPRLLFFFLEEILIHSFFY